MFRKCSLLLMVIAVLMGLVVSPLGAQSPTRVVWFVGLGTGGAPEQLAMQEQVVAAFNAANPDIELVLNIAENNVARDTLSTLIAAGNAPDIIGPVGTDGANAFAGNWLDLQPLVDSTGYDLTQWNQARYARFRMPGCAFLMILQWLALTISTWQRQCARRSPRFDTVFSRSDSLLRSF